MPEFPLYTSLLSGLVTAGLSTNGRERKDKDLTATQKADFLKKIEKITPEGHELIYALIKTFYISNLHEVESENKSFTIPYDGKMVKNNVTFDMDALPVLLRQLVYKFIKIHLKKVKEDKLLEKNREEVNEGSLADVSK